MEHSCCVFQPKMIFTLGYGFLRGARTTGQRPIPAPSESACPRTNSLRPSLLRRSLRRTRSTDITSIPLALFEYPLPFPSCLLPPNCALCSSRGGIVHSPQLNPGILHQWVLSLLLSSSFSILLLLPLPPSLSLLNFQSHNSAVDIPPSLRFLSLSLSLPLTLSPLSNLLPSPTDTLLC